MSEELLINWIKVGSVNLETAKERMIKIADELTRPELKVWYYDYYGDNGDNVSSDDMISEIKSVIKEVVNMMIEGNNGVYSFSPTNEFEIYLAGGMSNGDSPSLAYNTFAKFIALPESITKELEKN